MTNDNINYKDENPFNLHYLRNEIEEYSNISEFETTNTVTEEKAVRTAFFSGTRDENSLTNNIFFDRHKELKRDERLKPNQKELIEEWLHIRNNIVRPIIAELKSKGKESPTYSGPTTLDKLLGPLPEPIKLPLETPVEFAPEPVGTAHWPVRSVRSEDKDWHIVSYMFGPGKNDFVRGRNRAREFYASRGVDRLHAAIDLYGNAGDLVVAIQDGIFLYAIENFLGNTSAMYIQHTIGQPNVIFVYGEVEKNSWKTFNLKIGDKVKAGQVIAKLGITPGGSSMLHCETWGLGITAIKNRLHSSFRSWKKGGMPPKYVLNPTKYLLAVRKQEVERRKQQQQGIDSPKYKSTFNESLVPNGSESFLGSFFPDTHGRLMWGKEYDTVSSAYRSGNKDVNSLTNLIFFERYPGRKDKKIDPKTEPEKANEWRKIQRDIVIPITEQIKKNQSSISTSTPDLPLVLVGPIVRRATKTSVWFWIALSEKVISIYTTMFRYDNDGRVLNKIPLIRPKTIIRQLGKNFWVALFEVNPLEGSFPTDTIIGYDIEFQFYNKIPEHKKLSDLKLPINYIPFQLPTIVIGEKNTTIAHGSCRRPGAGKVEDPDSMKDAFGAFDDWIYEKRKLIYERPTSLILTGDQIYADDLSLPIFDAIKKISYDIFGYNEKINFGGGNFIPTNQISSKPKENENYFIVKPNEKEKCSMRKYLTHYSTSQFGFSTDDGEAHLLSFPEYASMYLLIWSKELWYKYCIGDDEIKKSIIRDYPTLSDYFVYVGACRRVMANCATYMIFDDHDVTDDWNLDHLWEEKTKHTHPGRQIIANALTAFMIFQGWGNDPDTFEETFKQSMLDHLNTLMIKDGKPGDNAESFYDIILSRHWSFMAASNPKALCVDTRTLREFPDTLERDPPDLKYKNYEKDYYRMAQEFYAGITHKFKRPAEGKSAILTGGKVWEKLNALLIKHHFAKNDVLLMVLPTPFFGHPFHIYAQEATYPYPSARYQGDWEQFDNNTSQRVALICLLKERFNPSAIVIFSGDVHYSSVINGGYAFAQTVKDAENKKWRWTIPVIQITSSPIKNVKDVLRKAVEGGDGKLGIVTEMLAPESRVRYTVTSKGSFIAVGLNTASLSGDLGKHTLIHQNNICIVTMPIAPENQVKSLFIGYKNGNLATTKTIVHIQNYGFMKPIYDLLHPTKFTIVKRNIGRILGSYVKAAGTFNKYATMAIGNYSLFNTVLDVAKSALSKK